MLITKRLKLISNLFDLKFSEHFCDLKLFVLRGEISKKLVLRTIYKTYSEIIILFSLPSENFRDNQISTKFVPVRPYPSTIQELIPPHDWLYLNIL